MARRHDNVSGQSIEVDETAGKQKQTDEEVMIEVRKADEMIARKGEGKRKKRIGNEVDGIRRRSQGERDVVKGVRGIGEAK